MSTTSANEYGVESGKELLEQGREPVGSGEIDVSQVLDSGVKRERRGSRRRWRMSSRVPTLPPTMQR